MSTKGKNVNRQRENIYEAIRLHSAEDVKRLSINHFDPVHHECTRGQ